jgi:hypothetical protein
LTTTEHDNAQCTSAVDAQNPPTWDERRDAVTPWVYVHALSTSNDVYQVFDHLPVLVVLETHRTVPFDRHQFVFKPEP